jgi:hypothetical protein
VLWVDAGARAKSLPSFVENAIDLARSRFSEFYWIFRRFSNISKEKYQLIGVTAPL